VGPGAALVGDAADFFDPFTGEGIYSALRGGELLAPYAGEAARARSGARGAAAADRALGRVRPRAPSGLPRQVEPGAPDRPVGGAAVAHQPRRARALAPRRHGRPAGGAAGDFVPPAAVLNPRYLWRLFAAPVAPPAEGAPAAVAPPQLPSVS
jgi:hypothetical protein